MMPLTSSSSLPPPGLTSLRPRGGARMEGHVVRREDDVMVGNNNDLSIIVKSLLITLMVQKTLVIFYESRALLRRLV